jgi:hypothetical protein
VHHPDAHLTEECILTLDQFVAPLILSLVQDDAAVHETAIQLRTALVAAPHDDEAAADPGQCEQKDMRRDVMQQLLDEEWDGGGGDVCGNEW